MILFVVLLFYQRARDALKQCLPEPLKDPNFAMQVISEESVQRWLALLLKNVSEPSVSASATVGPPPGVSPPPGVPTPAAPPALSKPTSGPPPGVGAGTTLNYAAPFKSGGWNT